MTSEKAAKVDAFLYRTKAKLTLTALLDGPKHNAELARKVNMTQQAVSRLLKMAWVLDLITYHRERGRRVNELTDYGRGIAEQLAKAQEKAAPKPEP